jgi:hypothetical protein
MSSSIKVSSLIYISKQDISSMPSKKSASPNCNPVCPSAYIQKTGLGWVHNETLFGHW